jgi:hypothetical protein
LGEAIGKFAGWQAFIASTDLCLNFTLTKLREPESCPMGWEFRNIPK